MENSTSRMDEFTHKMEDSTMKHKTPILEHNNPSLVGCETKIKTWPWNTIQKFLQLFKEYIRNDGTQQEENNKKKT